MHRSIPQSNGTQAPQNENKMLEIMKIQKAVKLLTNATDYIYFP